MITILIVVLLILLICGLPATGISNPAWGYGPSGIIGLIVIILIVLLLMGRL